MRTILGLKNLYEIFKDCLNKNQNFLDPKHKKEDYPKDFFILQYTLSLSEFNVRGDTTNEAMAEFCKIYELNSANQNPQKNLYNKDILSLNGNKLRIPGSTNANGLYIYKK